MLTQFRGAFKGTFGRILGLFVVALTILAFAFVGLPNLDNFGRPSPLEIGNQKYSATELRNEFNRQLDNYRQQTGEYLTTAEAAEIGLLDRTLRNMTLRSIIDQDASSYRLTATNDMVRDYMESEPAFANPSTGNFDRQRLIRILQSNNLSLEGFRNEMRSDLVRSQLMNSISASTPAPTAWVELLLKRQAEVRNVTYVRIATPAEAIDPPTDEQLQAYYDENSEAYTAPEFRTFRAIILRNEDFMEGLDTSEEELRRLFDSRQAALSEPERRTVRQLTYQTESEAAAALSGLQDGTPFEELAEAQGLPVERVTYENVSEDDLTDPTIANALFSVEETGTPVGPVHGLFGHTIGEVLEITPAEEAVFEEERETLEAELLEGATSRRLYDAVESIELARDTGASLEEAVEEVPGATLVSYGPVDRDLFTPEGNIVDSLPVEVLEEAFVLEPGEDSPVLELETEEAGQRGFFAVALDDVRDPTIRPFEEVRGEVTAAWLREQRRAAAEEQLAALRSAVEGGADLTAAAQEIGAEATTIQLSLQNQQQQLPAEFIDTLYQARLDTMVSEWAQNDTVAYAGVVRDVTFGNIPQMDQMLEMYKQTAGQQLASELSEAYVLAAQNDFEVRRDEEQIARLFQLGSE